MEKKLKLNNIITLPEITVTTNKDGTTTVTTNKDLLDKWKRTNNFMIPIDRTKQRLSEMRRRVSLRDGIGRLIAMHTPGIFNPLAWTTSMIGGYAIDEAAKALGYDSYGNMAYKNSPVLLFIGKHTSPTAVKTVAEFFNPGYIIGAGLHVPTDKSMRIFHNNISKNSKAKLISKLFEKIKNNSPEINTENNPAHTLYVDKNGKLRPIQTLPQTQENPLNDIIDLARQGNVEAILQIKQYGLEPGNPGVYRFVSQEEVDNILNGGKYAGRFNDGRVDVTANPNGTTAASNAFRITFKPEFDLYKPSQRVRMKNAQLQDGWMMDGYGLDDVATIERRLPNGAYETTYNYLPKTTTQKKNPLTSLIFYERQPSKISNAERSGMPKGERNLPLLINPLSGVKSDIDIWLINRTNTPLSFINGKSVWHPGYGRTGTKRKTVHFTTHQPVTDHMYGRWGDASETVITPYQQVVFDNGNPMNIEPMDTYFSNQFPFIIRQNGTKIFTSNPFNYRRYKSMGVDAETSKKAQLAHRILELLKKDYKTQQEQATQLFVNSGGTFDQEGGWIWDNVLPENEQKIHKMLFDPRISKRIGKVRDIHDKIHRDWVKEQGKIPNLETYLQMESETGRRSFVKKPYLYSFYDRPSESIEYHSTPTTHYYSWHEFNNTPEGKVESFIRQASNGPEFITDLDIQMFELVLRSNPNVIQEMDVNAMLTNSKLNGVIQKVTDLVKRILNNIYPKKHNTFKLKTGGSIKKIY